MAFETVPANDRVSGPYVATAGQTVFLFDFPAYQASEVEVTVVAGGVLSALVAGVQYTITLNSNGSGGTVTLVTPALAGEIITIYGDTSLGRETAFDPRGDFTATEVNRQLNRLHMLAQEAQRDLDRSLRAPVGESLLPLPSASLRAGKFASYDVNGQPVAASAILPTATPVTAFMAGLNASASSAAAARSLLEISPDRVVNLTKFGAIADPTYTIVNPKSVWDNFVAAVLASGLPGYIPSGRYRFDVPLEIEVTQRQYLGFTIFGDGQGASILDLRAVKAGAPCLKVYRNLAGLAARDFVFPRLLDISVYGERTDNVPVFQLGSGDLVDYSRVDYCNFPSLTGSNFQNFGNAETTRAVAIHSMVGGLLDFRANCGTGGYVGGVGVALSIKNSQFYTVMGSFGSSDTAIEIAGGFNTSAVFLNVDMENVKRCFVTKSASFDGTATAQIKGVTFLGGQFSYSSHGFDCQWSGGQNISYLNINNNAPSAFTKNATLVNGSNIITLAAEGNNLPPNNGLIVGRGVSGGGIPVGATIIALIGQTQAQLSVAATGSGTVQLTFAPAAASDFVKGAFGLDEYLPRLSMLDAVYGVPLKEKSAAIVGLVNGATVNIAKTIAHTRLFGGATVATQTIALPAVTANDDGLILTISSNQDITSLGVITADGKPFIQTVNTLPKLQKLTATYILLQSGLTGWALSF